MLLVISSINIAAAYVANNAFFGVQNGFSVHGSKFCRLLWGWNGGLGFEAQGQRDKGLFSSP